MENSRVSRVHPILCPSSKRTDTFGLFLASISGGLTFPIDWPTVANEQAYPIFVAILAAGRVHGFTDPYVLPENPVGLPPDNSSDLAPSSYPLEAIGGADGALSNGVPLKKVFDDLVATTRDRTPTCMSSVLVILGGFVVDREPKSVPCGAVCKYFLLAPLYVR